MTTNGLIEEKVVDSRPLEGATSLYILDSTQQARISSQKLKTVGSHDLYLFFSPLYVSFCTTNIPLFTEDTESFKYSAAVVLMGLVKYHTDGTIQEIKCLVRNTKHE